MLSVGGGGVSVAAISGTGWWGVRGTGSDTGVYGYSDNGYGVYCYALTNNYGCGGNRIWYYSSDETLKENISAVSDALTKIKQLRGVSYNWKADTEKKRQIGMIAQEVRNVVPEAVGQDQEGNYTMSDGPLVALLTEAIKEQQKQIEALKATVEALLKK